MNLNKVFILGNLTRDPGIRTLPSGQLVANFGVATNRFFYNKNREKQKQTEFHNIVAFGRNAEIAQQYLKKGSIVLIEGRLRTTSWQDSSGNNRSRTEIVVERLQLGPKAGQIIPPEAPEKAAEEIPIIEEEGEIDISSIPF
ncbi:MAG: single-stranded DNA-binding protein [Patescibacteria group bacterium]|nr:single-stranded DNA-binding protein [Patescibacteria group bacterium]